MVGSRLVGRLSSRWVTHIAVVVLMDYFITTRQVKRFRNFRSCLPLKDFTAYFKILRLSADWNINTANTHLQCLLSNS